MEGRSPALPVQGGAGDKAGAGRRGLQCVLLRLEQIVGVERASLGVV